MLFQIFHDVRINYTLCFIGNYLFFFERGRKCGVPEKACFLGCYLIAAQVVYVVVKKQYKLSSKK